MESIAVEAIRQIPAFMLAIMAFYFYRSTKKSEGLGLEAATIPPELASEIRSSTETLSRLETELSSVKETVDESDSLAHRIEESEEAIRSQLSNQKMALKEFGRVLSKTSEQTYTEFGSFEERIARIEESLKERGLIEDENRSAAA